MSDDVPASTLLGSSVPLMNQTLHDYVELALLSMLAEPFAGADPYGGIENTVVFQPDNIDPARLFVLQKLLKRSKRSLQTHVQKQSESKRTLGRTYPSAKRACLRAAAVQVWSHLSNRERNKLDTVASKCIGVTMRSSLGLN